MNKLNQIIIIKCSVNDKSIWQPDYLRETRGFPSLFRNKFGTTNKLLLRKTMVSNTILLYFNLVCFNYFLSGETNYRKNKPLKLFVSQVKSI